MAYIETHQSLLTHRKTLRLSRLLGLDRWAVAGRLMALWTWALDNAQEGIIEHADSDILADVMGWDGEPATLCSALVSAGFLDQRTTCYAIHDWMDYAGRLIEKRKSDAERKRRERTMTGLPRVVQRTSAGHPPDGAGTVPNPTLPNPTSPSGKVIVIERESAQGETKTICEPLTRTRTPSQKTRVTSSAEPIPLKPKPPNPLWDVLVEVFYEPTTSTEKSNFGKIVHQLKEVGATPDDVRFRVRQHAKAQNHWDLTPNALVTHWSELAGKNGKGSSNHGTTQQEFYDPAKDEKLLERKRAGARLVQELSEQQTPQRLPRQM